jgi:NAD(P)-dependent dehydrogenase (short-subunit alcohol dehydrogenase family)
MTPIPCGEHTLVMTGGSSGLGRTAAAHLLREHPEQHLLIVVRGRRPDQIAEELTAETGNRNVSTVSCDLASFDQVRVAAFEIGRRVEIGRIPPLGGFLGNAAVQMPSRTRVTTDGFELTFGVNVLAHYLLLRLLLERFAAPSRIVITGSNVHFADFKHTLGLLPAPRWTNTESVATADAPTGGSSPRAGQQAYATSKLAVIYLVHALARRLPEGIDAYTYNPGGVPGTGLGREAPRAAGAVRGAIFTLLRITPLITGLDEASRLLAAAVSGPRPGESGAYLEHGTAAQSSPESYDEAREEELWTTAGRLCGFE